MEFEPNEETKTSPVQEAKSNIFTNIFDSMAFVAYNQNIGRVKCMQYPQAFTEAVEAIQNAAHACDKLATLSPSTHSSTLFDIDKTLFAIQYALKEEYRDEMEEYMSQHEKDNQSPFNIISL